MTDLLALGVAPASVFAATATLFFGGLVTSVGPCVAPRYIAVSALCGGYRTSLLPAIAFVAGINGAMLALGFGSGWVATLWQSSGVLYGVLASGLIVGGCVTLARGNAHRHHRAAGTTRIANMSTTPSDPTRARSLGAVVLMGALSTLVVSPCCTPVVAAVAAASVASGHPAWGVLLILSFGCGHCVPLFFAGGAAVKLRKFVDRRVPQHTPAVVAGSLMIVLGSYYGLLV